MGIESKAFEIGTGGALIKGKNRSGKTSIMQAFVSALTGVGIDSNHIRAGADRAEILIDFADPVAQARRIARRSGHNELETDGIGLGKQQTRLNDLIGPSISPLALLNAKPAERRKMILEAMPASVTAEDMERWTGTKWTDSVDGHGLEVIRKARDWYYAQRTEANKRAREARDAHARASAEAARLDKDAPTGIVIPLPGEEKKPVEAAHAALAALNQRRAQAAEQERKAQGTREKIASLRADADAEDSAGHLPVQPEILRGLEDAVKNAGQEVAAAEQALVAAQAKYAHTKDDYAKALQAQRAHDESGARSASLRRQAAAIESSLASVAIETPTDAEMDAAREAILKAEAHAMLVDKGRKAHDALAESCALGDEMTEAQKAADELDAIVTTLTTAAPAELAARTEMIKGLTFTDDGGLALDGVVLDLLSGQEAIDFCVQVAKRAHPKCKLLTADKLEQLDPESLEAFVKMATADGWQLIGTRVEAGEMVIELLEAA
jgi:DNA repair exonuclease SbcCD ATPase subunit